MPDFLEIDEKNKTITFLNLDDLSVDELKIYLDELKSEINRVNLEVSKKNKSITKAEEYFR